MKGSATHAASLYDINASEGPVFQESKAFIFSPKAFGNFGRGTGEISLGPAFSAFQQANGISGLRQPAGRSRASKA
jgi:hypothetical protein